MLRRRILPAVLVALALAGCPSVDRDGEPASFVVAALDATTGAIPLPNDLALQAAPSRPAGVQREVLFSFIGNGGWPGDQTITIPLRTMVRNEAGAFAPSATPPAGVDTTTITASTVAIVRVSDNPVTVLEPEFVGYGPDPANPAVGLLRLRPRGGLAVGRYVVALRGGANGVKTSDGAAISPDRPVALVAPNLSLASPENQPPGLTPAQAADLERLRAALANPIDWAPVPSEAACRQALGIPPAVPLPEATCWLPSQTPTASGVPALAAAAQVFPASELASIQTFEVSAPAVVADTATGVLPFPSDFLLGADGKVRNIPSLGPAAPGLATLDGFSTTSLLLVPLSGPVNADTITRDNVLLFELVPTGVANPPFAPRQLADVTGGGTPEYLTQPPNLVQTVGTARVSTAIGLQPAVPAANAAGAPVMLPPLKPRTRYLVVVTDGVTDLAGAPLARGTLATLLLTVQTPLFDPTKPEGQRSNVPGVADADAAGLEAARTALRPVVQPIEAATGKRVVMAYTVTTQNVKTVSADLTALPYNVAQAAPTFFGISTVADFDPTAAPFNVPAQAVAGVSFVSAEIPTLDVLDATTGALNPAVPTWTPAEFTANRREVPALVAYPSTCSTTAPCVAPLVVFHHGLNGGRLQMIPAARQLAAKGFVVAAIDAPFHGDRASCDADADCDGGTCTLDPANQKAPGTCTGGNGLAFDPARLTTVASGNYFVSENFFRIRDSIRQDLLDQSALVLAIAPPPGGTPSALATRLLQVGVAVNPTQVYFAGTSLGGMIGTSVVATNPRISRAAFSVSGATMVDVFTNAPAFRQSVGALFANLIPGFTFEKVDSTNAAFDPAIAQRYAQTLIVAKWILDPAEPINYAADVTTKVAANPTLAAGLGPLAVTATSVYGQMVENDPVVPNPFNALLYANGQIPFTLYTSTTIPVDQRHGLLLAPTAAGEVIRGNLADFLETTTPAAASIALP